MKLGVYAFFLRQPILRDKPRIVSGIIVSVAPAKITMNR